MREIREPRQVKGEPRRRWFYAATCELVVIALRESGPGLLQCLDTLMIAETNIDFAYALLPNPEGHSMLAMHVEDYDFAVSILHQSGFKLIYQDDLSR